MNGESHIPIDPADLSAGNKMQRANALLSLATWKPGKKASSANFAKGSAAEEWARGGDGQQAEQQVTIIKTLLERISRDPLVLSEDANHIVHTVRDAMCFGYLLAELYGKAAGLEALAQQNGRSGGLASAQQAEFNEKQATMAAVALFGMASYVCFHLGPYKEEETRAVQMEISIPEVFTANAVQAVQCSVFWYGFSLERSGLVKTDLQTVKLTKLYFEKLLEEIKGRAASLKHTEFFSRVSYKVKGSDLIIKGFEETGNRIVVGTEFKTVSFDEIVGNQEAKHAAQRLAERLVCYDLTAHQNPFQALGGIPNLSMGKGNPGTGKSMQIAATATLLKQYCDLIGLPFLFWPLPDNVVSTFQGGSAERMIPWMQRLQDKGTIVYAPIDDAENNLEERTRQGVSSGVREVIGVFLRYTEGAYAIQRGNSVIQIMTNLPEQVDKAVLSRIQSRFSIDGATTLHDFYDQDGIWYGKFEKISKDFVSMTPLAGYRFLADQAKVASLEAIEKDEPELRDKTMIEALHATSKKYGRKDHAFFAALFESVKNVYPWFSSRDVRNIQKAVDGRVLDFDLPKKWFDDLDLFFKQSYERKLELIKGLMAENMQGLSFADIRYRETIKYLNVAAEITNVERERAIDNEAKQMAIRQEAMSRLQSKRLPA